MIIDDLINDLENLKANKKNHPLVTRPPELEYYLAPEEYNLVLRTLKTLIKDYNTRIGWGGEGGQKIPIIKKEDLTDPSDKSVFSSSRTMKEIEDSLTASSKYFISKINPDSAWGRIRFEDGASFGSVGDLEQSYIDRYGNSALKSLKIKEWLEVPELRFNRVEVNTGDKWRAPGGGVIESVSIYDEPVPITKIVGDKEETIITHGVIVLKLEDGEFGAISENDLCTGIFQSMTSSNNAVSNTDDGKGNRTIKGFATSYFRVVDIYGDNKNTFTYSLREQSSSYLKPIHPQKFMHFAAFGNTINKDRQSSAYETRTYERFLINVSDWEYSFMNVAAQFGDLSNLAALGINARGYSIYLNDVYFSGNIEQIKPPRINKDGFWEIWDKDAYEWITTTDRGVPPRKDGIYANIIHENVNIVEEDLDLSWAAVHVFEGDNELKFVTEGETLPGQYKITLKYDAGAINPGTLKQETKEGKTYAYLSKANSITYVMASIDFEIVGKRFDGMDFSFTRTQVLQKVPSGIDGKRGDSFRQKFRLSIAKPPQPTGDALGWSDTATFRELEAANVSQVTNWAKEGDWYVSAAQPLETSNSKITFIATAPGQRVYIKVGMTGLGSESAVLLGEVNGSFPSPTSNVSQLYPFGSNETVWGFFSASAGVNTIYIQHHRPGTEASTARFKVIDPSPEFKERIWVTQQSVINSIVSPWSVPVEWNGKDGSDGKNGLNGLTGPAPVFTGPYEPEKGYYGTLVRSDIVEYGSTYYIAKFHHKENAFIGQTPSANSTYWEKFGATFESIATSLLLAKEANIAGFIFKDNMLISQKGTLNGVDSNEFGETGFKPNLVLDGVNGLITAKNANIEGTLESPIIGGGRTVMGAKGFEIYNDKGKMNILIGVENGHAVMNYYNNNGLLLYSMGPSGLSVIDYRAESWEELDLVSVYSTTDVDPYTHVLTNAVTKAKYKQSEGKPTTKYFLYHSELIKGVATEFNSDNRLFTSKDITSPKVNGVFCENTAPGMTHGRDPGFREIPHPSNEPITNSARFAEYKRLYHFRNGKLSQYWDGVSSRPIYAFWEDRWI